MPILASGEKQLDQVIASCLGRRGIFYLTDRRIIFEYGEGLFAKTYRQFGASLGDIQAVNASHSYLGGGGLVISTSTTNNGFGTNKISIQIAMSPEVWITKINNLLNTTNYRSPQPTIVIEKEVVKIPCKYCRALFDPYRNNTCPQCGAPLHTG